MAREADVRQLLRAKSKELLSSAKLATWIELRHLRYFIAAVEHGSFRKASAALGVQESAISRRVRDLEDHIGASVFRRSNAGVQLTKAGERFLTRARRALRQLEEGAGDAAAIGRNEHGELKIGIFSSIASGFLRTLLETFGLEHPGVDIELIDGNPSDHIAAVRQQTVDVAFVTGTRHWPGCETTRLWSERVFLVLPSEHPLCAKEQVEWTDLVSHSFMVSDAAPGQEIHDYLVQRLAELGHHPEIVPQFIGRDNLLALVSMGHSLTVTSEASTALQIPGVSYRPIRNEVLPFSAVWSAENDNPAARRLLSLAKSLAQPNTVRLGDER